jgi:hypothetical protein
MGRRSVQLIVKDVKLASDNRDHYDNLRNRYLEINAGASFRDDENVLPSREDFAKLYRFILASLRQGGDSFTHRELISELAKIRDGHEIGFIKLKFMIKVFRELNIIGIEEMKRRFTSLKFLIHPQKPTLKNQTF